MAAEWSKALEHRLIDTIQPSTNDDGRIATHSTSIWETLESHLNMAERRPQQNPDVIARRLDGRRGPYFVLKNTRQKTYLRLSPAEYHLWEQMDGQSSIEDLIVEHYMETKSFAHHLVLRLVEQLHRNHMLTDAPFAIWSQLQQAMQQRSWLYRLSAPARALLNQRLSINNLDKFISWLYRSVGWLFFTRGAQVLFFIVSIAGLLVFFRILNNPSNVFIDDNVITSLALLWMVAIFPIVVHELGHALTVKHYGREVPKGGVMLFFGLPAAFVETTDIWLEPRRARLAVTWNGPYTGLILGGIASLVIYIFPQAPVNPLLLKLAGFAYLTVFFNVNPLFKLDGYYLLSDALDIPMLRERSLDFVRHKLWPKLHQRKPFSREDWIFSIFGVLSLLWTVYALYLVYFFWRTRLQFGLQMLFGDGYPLLARLFSTVLVTAMISFGVLLLINLYRLGRSLLIRFASSGLLENHTRLALLGAGLSLSFGLGLPAVISGNAAEVAALLSALIGVGSCALLLHFNRTYMNSPRSWTHVSLALAMVLASLAPALELFLSASPTVQALRMSALAGLVVGGLFTFSRPMARIGARPLLLGFLVGGGVLSLLTWIAEASISNATALLIAAIVITGTYAVLSLQGGARAPAMGLVYAGGVLLGLDRLASLASVGLGFTGTLMLAAGCLHLVYARLPKLSTYTPGELSSETGKAMRASVQALVRRVIAQVFFETGWRGVNLFAKDFSQAMQQVGLDISIRGNQFQDPKLPDRTVDELTEVYGVVFDELHELIRRELGGAMGRLTFAYGVDLIPWQHREVVAELILSRRPWAGSISQEFHESKATRRDLLKRVPLFANCTSEELDRIAIHLKTEQIAAGEVIVQQGEAGDKFYIIERGSISILQQAEDEIETQVMKLGPGQYFGEVALVTNAPRNATAHAETPARLLSLEKRDFDRLVRQYVSLAGQVSSEVRYVWLVRGMPLFDELESHEIELLAAILQPETYQAGEIVFREGEPGDKFYIVEAGELAVIREVDGRMVEVSRRGPGEYVGEIALLEKTPRTATIQAVKETTLLALEGQYFLNLISNFVQLRETISRTGSRRRAFLKSAVHRLPASAYSGDPQHELHPL